MKLGVMAALFAGRSLEEALGTCVEIGIDAIELPVGAYPGQPFFDPRKVLGSAKAQAEIKAQIADHGLELSALAVHGNPVHPDRARAKADHAAFETAVQLAPKLGTEIVITFSGCPGGAKGDRQPNWVTCAWPPEYGEILRYQWEEVLVPYWAEQARFAHRNGVRVAWEPHPGFSAYNPDTTIRLSERAMKASGVKAKRPVLGCNLDPSHLFWQGIDPVKAIAPLADAGLLLHVHAKDTELSRREGPVNGYLDARPYDDLRNRSWIFRTCGWGHGHEFWRPFVSELRRCGYDHVLSIEHEDALMSVDEGLERAVAFLSDAMILEPPANPWWS
jgi:sugar phosphate isomerase/epimerase